jgi:DNA segregation ATPase FtsK/SpoIIIE-like protein
MGTVVYADEEVYEERMQRLLDKLTNLVDERQQILSNADTSNLYDYNERFPEQSLPAMLVAIDNFAELYENYESLVESTIVPLVRRSLSMGITFVVTCNVPNNMPSKLYNLFGERVTFKQSNTDRYMDIVGRGAIEIDEIPGRGYIRVGKQPLLFQVALPVGIFSEEDGRDRLPEGDELRLLARNMRRHLEAGKTTWRHRPDPINILPELVSLQEMLAQADSLKSGRIQAVLGQDSSLKPALFDLKRLGPHFAIAGPPLSGKTTTLYNWVLSLADRYPPERVKLVLIDFQRKFVEYDGQHKLSDLPHVLSAISEVEELEALLPRLKAECEVMATQDVSHELFIIIDNYDDLSEEIERARDLPRELAGLARRYGRDGLHYIIAGTLDNMNELRKRVQAANYGLGLRSAQAVEALKVMRPPAQVRNKELQAGRGFIVKSGQATMIQVAAPYEVMAAAEELENQAEKVAQGLDKWVEKIQAKYPEQRAAWSNQTNGSTPAQMVTSQQNARTIRMMNLLQRSMQKELAHLGEGNGSAAELITAKLVQMDMGHWNNADTLLQLLKEVWVKEKRASGLPDELIQTLVSVLDEESLLLEIEAAVAQEEEGSGN